MFFSTLMLQHPWFDLNCNPILHHWWSPQIERASLCTMSFASCFGVCPKVHDISVFNFIIFYSFKFFETSKLHSHLKLRVFMSMPSLNFEFFGLALTISSESFDEHDCSLSESTYSDWTSSSSPNPGCSPCTATIDLHRHLFSHKSSSVSSSRL